jgi:glucose-1-phosphate cytidylyltransferase
MDGRASAGFFVFNRRVLDYLDATSACVLERAPLERLAQAGELMAYRHDGFFYAMDTYREYTYLNDLWNAGSAPWHVWRNENGC